MKIKKSLAAILVQQNNPLEIGLIEFPESLEISTKSNNISAILHVILCTKKLNLTLVIYHHNFHLHHRQESQLSFGPLPHQES